MLINDKIIINKSYKKGALPAPFLSLFNATSGIDVCLTYPTNPFLGFL